MNQRLERVGSAAAGIAHDINNQLTLILNHLSMQNVDSAREAAFRCSSLTSSLLAYCRGESLNLRTVKLGEFIRDFAGGVCVPPGVHLLLEVSEALDEVRADTVALNRALTNLVTNACDAMQGSGLLKITIQGRNVEVCDDGPGINPENLRKIFEPFFSTKGSNGTGLGLAIVRDIMRQHGGSVTVTSQPGQGARFQLRFNR